MNMKQKCDCKNCGQCCEPISLTLNQVVRINRWLRDNPDVITMLNQQLSQSEDEEKEEKCIFLSQEKKCLVYPVRPEICKAFGVDGVGGVRCPNGNVASNVTTEEAIDLIETYSIYQRYELIDPRVYYSYLLKILDK